MAQVLFSDSRCHVSQSILRPCQLLLKIHDLFDLHQKPAVNLREVENLLDGEAGAQGVADEEDAFGVGHAQLAADDVAREDVAVAINFRADAPGLAVAAPAAAAGRARSPCLQRAQAFLQAFLERAADGHRFADAFHLRGERGLAGRISPRQTASGNGWVGGDVNNARIEAGVDLALKFALNRLANSLRPAIFPAHGNHQ